jgi:hypothetical protein
MLEFIENKDINGLLFYVAVRIAVVLVCWFFMVTASMIDFWSGRDTAKTLGEPIDSKGFRHTIIKVGDYTRVMLFALMFDVLGSFFTFYILPFATILCTVAILLIEGKSVKENSAKKKAHAADVPDVVKRIVQSSNVKQAIELLDTIRTELENNNRQN